MWNTDNPKPHTENFDVLYKAIPFLIVLKEQQAFGLFFDNTFESHFDMGKENSEYYYYGVNEGNLDYYFIYGPSIKEVVTGYTKLTGSTPVPQRWTLGYQQCKWAYVPDERLFEVAQNFRERDIPCDALYLDIDYMKGYRVFTWNDKMFPNPKMTLSKLQDDGFKVVTIIDPAVKKDKGYYVFEEGLDNNYFATDRDGVPYVNKVWPGDSLYPDFLNSSARKWWGKNIKTMLDTGVAGIWNDMNEPASFNGPLPDDIMFNRDGLEVDHKEAHNIYGHYMCQATYEAIKEHTNKRPFLITRACYAGTQKYSAVWTGDNHSIWEHLRMALPMLMNLGLSGVSFCGTDVGGFGFDSTPELLSRWYQVGCFSALFRNHSPVLTRDQEPWAFDKQTEDIVRKYIKLRYQLIPYLYDLLWQGETNGLPVLRPLMMHYQDDLTTYELNDEFLCGENILVAPIVEQGKTVRLVYLPNGSDWIDYWTKEVHKGGSYIIKEAPLDVCPIYVKAGGILPNYPVQNYVGEQQITYLILDVYPSVTETNYVHYQDDGESFDYQKGGYNLYQFTVSMTKDEKEGVFIKINKDQSGYQQAYQGFRFIVNKANPTQVLANGQAVEFSKFEHGIEVIVDADITEIVLK
jgi:alpha-glucosidase